jgi:hypothetical protein
MKGYQRKMICLKQTGSELFEEAYFVMRREKESDPYDEEALLAEANRIVNNQGDVKKKRRAFPYRSFFWGAIGASCVCLLFALLLLFFS